jgi:hypothetical protein
MVLYLFFTLSIKCFATIWKQNFKMIWDLIFMDIFKIQSQIKSAYFNVI